MASVVAIGAVERAEVEGLSLWRYMGLATFLALLSSSKLHFTPLKCFQDNFEGAPSKDAVAFLYSRYMNMKAGEQGASEVPKKLARDRRHTYVSCWHESEIQSDAMWRIYSRLDEGVAIRTTSTRLHQSILLDGVKQPLAVGRVIYKGHPPQAFGAMPQHMSWVFVKRESFAHEKEYRLAYHLPAEDTFDPSVDLHELIMEVVVSPWMKPWFLEMICAVCAKYSLDVKVHPSGLLDGPDYSDVLPAATSGPWKISS